MRAALMYGKGDIRIEDVPIPEPRQGELLIRVTAAGICGTDLSEYTHGPKLFSIENRHRQTGHLGPLIPGHEFGGRVVGVGPDVDGFTVGDLVASGAGVSCGACFQCLDGLTNLCVDYWTVGLNRHGGLAEFVTAPASCCLEVASLGITETTVSLPQPMSIAVHAMRRGRPEPGADVVVVGAGGIGAFLIYALLAAGHRVTTIDIDEGKLDIPSALGATTTTDPDGVEPVRVVYEASGSGPGLRTAMAATLSGGRTVAIGLQTTDPTLDLHALSIGERELVGTNAHRFAESFESAARLVGSRQAGWSDFVADLIPLDDLTSRVLPEMADRSSNRIKHVFDPAVGS
ncbi:MAG: alcohol dehydrogenase catalytic domain-containing protein [Acidimicrobiia bacterium]|nr:alcohol dehydrogenase catalytic domain-containing protein [Acidimicrobiia bacterium]